MFTLVQTFFQIPRKSVGMIDYLTSLEIKSSSQAYQPPTLDDLVHNFMRDQHMQVNIIIIYYNCLAV